MNERSGRSPDSRVCVRVCNGGSDGTEDEDGTDKESQGMRYRYREILARAVPGGIRFDVPMRNQGQIIEIAYGTFGRGEAGYGDEYQRVYDRSDGTTRYYRRVTEAR